MLDFGVWICAVWVLVIWFDVDCGCVFGPPGRDCFPGDFCSWVDYAFLFCLLAYRCGLCLVLDCNFVGC